MPAEEETVKDGPFVYVPQSGSGLRDAMAELCLERAESGSGGYSTSASFISACASKLGLVSSGVFPATERPDEVFLAFSATQTEGCFTAERGDIIFFEEGFDREYLEMNGIKDNTYASAGIITAADEEIITYVTTDGDGSAVLKSIPADTKGPGMKILRAEYPSCEKLVWDALSSTLPYGDAALCAVMANIYCESGFDPSAVGDGGDSIGLCQWYRERKDELLLYCAENGYSPDSVRVQTDYLAHELQTEKYSDVDIFLKNAEESPFGAGYAAYVFCLRFENPSDAISKARFRGSVAQAMYSYYHGEETEEDIALPEEIQVPLPQISPLRMDPYRGGDFPVFMDILQDVDELTVDGEILDCCMYRLEGNGGTVVILQQFMETLSPGWHDIAVISKEAFAGGQFRTEYPDASALMCRPAFTEDTTAIFFTDAPGPRCSVDISRAQDFGVVLWYEGTVCYISTQREGVKVLAPEDCRYLFTPFGEGSSLPFLSEADVSMLDTSGTVNMSGMFEDAGAGAQSFCIAGLGKWDVGNVTDMSGMFKGAGRAASDWTIGDLSTWNVASVTDMTAMFSKCGENALIWSVGELCSWNTSSVVSMAGMFEGAGYNSAQFILDLRWWDVSGVCSMQAMFRNAGYYTDIFSVNAGVWDISSVVTMEEMFLNAGFSAREWSLGDISRWDVSKVRTMRNMFRGAGREAAFFCLDMSMWDTRSCEDMAGMFEYAGFNAGVFELRGLECWDVSSVADFERMLAYAGYTATNFGFDLRGWNVGSASDMAGMFESAGFMSSSFRLQLEGWDTSGVRNMSDMFSNAGRGAVSFALTGLESWDVSSVEDASGMFEGAGYAADSFILELNGWNVYSLLDAGGMFADAGCCARDFLLGVDNWQLPDSCASEGMFANTGSSAGYTAPQWYMPGFYTVF